MKTEIGLRGCAPRRDRLALVLLAIGWMIFIVSVLAFSEVRAQSVSLTDQNQMLEMYRQSKSRGAATPEVYTSPLSEPAQPETPRVVPPAEAAQPATSAPIVFDDSLPKPGGKLERFGASFFAIGSENYKPPAGPVAPSYILGPGDRLYLTTWGRVDLEYDLAVDPSGQVYVPKVGAVRAFGLSLSEFEQKLRARLSSVYSDFELSVTVSQIRAVSVHVYGEAVRPGAYSLNALSTLLDVLTAAGGPNERGSFRQIKVIRKTGKNELVDLYRFFSEGDLLSDMPVVDGDVVFVPVAGPQVKIRGEVRRPGIYELAGETSLAQLIDVAGGTRPGAYLGRVLVDRIDPADFRRVLDCNLTSEGLAARDNIALQDGDDVSIYAAYGQRENVVWVAGAVKHPGGYEHTQDMTVAQLLKQAGGLVPEAYTRRADLERYPAAAEKSLIQVDLATALADSTAGPRLLPRDRLVVYDRFHLERPKSVRIEGAVKAPGEYDLFESMRLSDLVFRAGNPNRSAYLYRAELARLGDDGKTELLYADLGTVMDQPSGGDDPMLREDDYVFVREIPKWRNQEVVELTGEVMFPGGYALASEGETLWDLLQRAGGFTDHAFLRGTVFTRKSIAEDVVRADYARVVESTTELREDSLGQIRPTATPSIQPERLTRIVIDVDRLVRSKGREGNVMLRRGDRIYIPQTPSGIQVMGAVAAPGTILYEQGRKLDHYVGRAGNYTKQSDRDNVRLIKADGRVYAGGEASGQKVEVGDAVFVPQKVQKDRDWWKIVTGSVSVVTGIATTALLVDRL
jgi:protein involved in polysaccharide export with SLBB domain